MTFESTNDHSVTFCTTSLSLPTTPVANLSRKDAERAVRRELMLRAAEEVFAERGYAHATLEEVAARAEFGKGTLYNYFEGGKQQLLLELIEEFFDHSVARIGQVLDPERGTSFRERLGQFVTESFQFFVERESLFKVLVREGQPLALSDDPSHVAFVVHQQQRVFEAMRPALEAATNAGEIRPLAPYILADVIVSNLRAWQLNLTTLRRLGDASAHLSDVQLLKADVHTVAGLVTDFLLDGIGMQQHDDN